MSSNSTLPPDSVEYLTNVVGVQYALVGAFVWLMYDYVLCIGLEVKYVWFAPWGLPKLLYVWTRYLGILLMALMVWTSSASNGNPRNCVAFFNIETWGSVWMMGTVSSILLLRIYAMYERSRKVAIFGVVISVGQVIAACVILGTQLVTVYTPPTLLTQFDFSGCFVGESPPALVTYWIARLVFDSLLLVMVGYKMTHRYVSYNKTDLLDIMIKDNVSTFIFIFCVQSVNLFTFRLAPNELASVALPFSIATDIIMSTRLILHIREAFFGPGEEAERSVDDKTIPLAPLRVRSQGVPSVRSHNGRRLRGSASYLNDIDFDEDEFTEEHGAAGVMVTVEVSTDSAQPRRSAFNPSHEAMDLVGMHKGSDGDDDSHRSEV
ncbi:hypothetical protein DACRYDRAFT_20921 [Dacryopinax primogenitus]|uniref:DUF6533 domain-containing protein n=1 Tax=Dacryopinax primogenitus (strain DJM 731) TaxID=1858805 RepID=M5GD94_DACPD|nr:uncharacterized protein DACRYDRAFT_20921 [Dacryopinax primogenitus]EJU04367.1 hypothetical protein DACRYDRAFT_20921 [Dacryopinax primogenitus]